MKILVTGANGFIGSHLVEFLLAKGFPIRCFLHSGDSGRDIVFDERLERVRGDLTDSESCRVAVEGCDVVFHLAGLSRYDARIPIDEYVRVNVGGTRTLLETSRLAGVKKFIYISSIEAVGLSLDGQPLTELSEPHPRNLYGQSKLEAERAVRHFHSAYGMDCRIVRPGATYGPGERLMFERLFKPVSKGFYPLIGDGSALMEFSYVKNQVVGIWRAAENGSPGETYFLSDVRPYPFKEVILAIAREMGVRLRLIPIPLAFASAAALVCEGLSKILRFHPFYVKETGRPPFSRHTLQWAAKSTLFCNTAKAREKLGHHPPYSLQQGLQETICWYKKQGWL